MIRWLLIVAYSVALLLVGQGCETTRDVSADRVVLQRGYSPGQVYTAMVDVAVLAARNPGETPALDRNGPDLSQRYPGRNVLRVLPAGTRFRVERITHVIIQAPVQGESYTEVVVTEMNARATPLNLDGSNHLSQWERVGSVDSWPTLVQRPIPNLLRLDLSPSIR